MYRIALPFLLTLLACPHLSTAAMIQKNVISNFVAFQRALAKITEPIPAASEPGAPSDVPGAGAPSGSEGVPIPPPLDIPMPPNIAEPEEVPGGASGRQPKKIPEKTAEKPKGLAWEVKGPLKERLKKLIDGGIPTLHATYKKELLDLLENISDDTYRNLSNYSAEKGVVVDEVYVINELFTKMLQKYAPPLKIAYFAHEVGRINDWLSKQASDQANNITKNIEMLKQGLAYNFDASTIQEAKSRLQEMRHAQFVLMQFLYEYTHDKETLELFIRQIEAASTEPRDKKQFGSYQVVKALFDTSSWKRMEGATVELVMKSVEGAYATIREFLAPENARAINKKINELDAAIKKASQALAPAKEGKKELVNPLDVVGDNDPAKPAKEKAKKAKDELGDDLKQLEVSSKDGFKDIGALQGSAFGAEGELIAAAKKLLGDYISYRKDLERTAVVTSEEWERRFKDFPALLKDIKEAYAASFVDAYGTRDFESFDELVNDIVKKERIEKSGAEATLRPKVITWIGAPSGGKRQAEALWEKYKKKATS